MPEFPGGGPSEQTHRRPFDGQAEREESGGEVEGFQGVIEARSQQRMA